MDFARKELEKYGWIEGRGLGRNENGISTAIKPKLKFDNAGIGHDIGQQFTNNWWEKLFDSAAQNIEIDNGEENQVKMKVKSIDAVEITTKTYSLKQLRKNQNLEYGSFLKTEKLTESGIQSYNLQPFEDTESMNTFRTLTDEELFAACGGRTAHKGARHGLKLGGKLSRIEKQEKLLLKKMKKVSLTDDKEKSAVEKKLKKLKRQKEENREKYTPLIEDSMESTSSSYKRNKSKKRKSVSFNETVTKIYTVDLDTSFDSEIGSIRDENSNEPTMENTASGSDEGIEQDIENNNNDVLDNHRSFEEAQFSINDLSKAERKKLKKKRKLEAKKNTSTGVFLQKLKENDEEESLADFESKDVNLKKRKCVDEWPHGDFKRGHSKTESPDRIKSKKCKRKRKKELKMEEKQMNSIVKSLGNFCRISESE